ncbi:MAG TPA: hypothetical protein VFB00_06600 [Terriglobales bacterium]|nr:hypothetical protein [Terriglobales bacterium]
MTAKAVIVRLEGPAFGVLHRYRLRRAGPSTAKIIRVADDLLRSG